MYFNTCYEVDYKYVVCQNISRYKDVLSRAILSKEIDLLPSQDCALSAWTISRMRGL